MTQIRSFISGIDDAMYALCDHGCKRTPEITIEDHPTRNRHAYLCLDCAAKDLSSDLQLMALALLTLVKRQGNGISLSKNP